MADTKLSALTALAVEMADTDEIYINDGGVSKKQAYSVLKAAFATAAQGTTADSALQNVVEDTTPQLGGSLDVNGQKIVSASNGNIDIEPNGTGNVLLGNFTFDADQTVGAGQDNYVLTYDNASGLISLEAGGSGDFKSDGSVDMTGTFGTDVGTFRSDVADGASAILFHIQDPSYTTSGSKLFQITNNTDPAFYVRFDGLLHVENYSLGLSTEISPQFNSITGTANTNTSKFGRGLGREIEVQSSSQYSVNLSAVVSATNGFAVFPNIQTGDFAAAPMHVRGGAAQASATTNVNGADLNLVGGASATGSGNGGDVVLTPGTGATANGFVKFGTHSAIVAETVTGYITIKDSGGTERKIAVVS